MNKTIIFGIIFLLTISFVSAIEPVFNNVTASNFFIGQSGQFNMTRTEYINENCLRYFEITIPAQFSIWIPPSTGIQVATTSTGGNIQTTASATILSYRDATNTEIGQINIAGNIWTLHLNDGDNPACLETSTITTIDSFVQGIFTNPNTQGSYTFSATSELSNDATIYNAGTPFIIIYNYLTYVSNLYNITNWNFECNQINNQTIIVNVTTPNIYTNNTYQFNFSVLNNINNTNICNYNITQVNYNNNSCSYTAPNIYNNITNVINATNIQICNGTVYYNVTNDFNNTFWNQFNISNPFSFYLNQTLNYTCIPQYNVDNFFNLTLGNGTYNYNYQNNLNLTGFSCPACTNNCNPAPCPATTVENNLNYTIPITTEGTMINIPQGGIYLIGAGIIFLAIILGIVFYMKNDKQEEPVKRTTAPTEAKKELSEFDKELNK